MASDINRGRDRWSAERHQIGICGRRLVLHSYDDPHRYDPMNRIEGFEFASDEDALQARSAKVPLPEPVIEFETIEDAKAWAEALLPGRAFPRTVTAFDAEGEEEDDDAP